MVPPGLLSIRETREGGVHRLTPIGELDLVTAPLLEAAFDAVFRDYDAEMIVVDLRELSFMDSTGIHLLLRMGAACQDADRLRVVNGSRAVERVLDLTGAREHLPIISSESDPARTTASVTYIDPVVGGEPQNA
jgi:anti-sigma B factor antagonist